jgi:hypothetical protein
LLLLCFSSPKLSDVANAFAVLNVKLRASLGNPDKRDKLSVSTPQVYQDLPGEVQVGRCALFVPTFALESSRFFAH